MLTFQLYQLALSSRTAPKAKHRTATEERRRANDSAKKDNFIPATSILDEDIGQKIVYDTREM